ncbi:hypothetical protein [Rhodococcus koreensis]|jgi:hypothetical protein|uniref:Uncharacterized protein n=1 Tax=Rhodococcus koreensis TaxID=99653 RepID=A0A1H4MDM8_9NOCA|nr:hypothetical protein [Rhodococcus koreensis]QSE84578.1 hypothetical protein JWS14_38380 [Rhodococcus koreensis]SEB80645.1 hypothetical protein SAMN04490239_1740 [Rhodococcus koreensis]
MMVEQPQRMGTSLLPVVAMVFGMLSVVTFWMPGVGVVLGVGGLAAGLLGTAAHSANDDESASLWALLGILVATLGLTTSAIAVLAGASPP